MTDDRIEASLAEIRESWSIADVARANQLLDAFDEARFLQDESDRLAAEAKARAK